MQKTNININKYCENLKIYLNLFKKLNATAHIVVTEFTYCTVGLKSVNYKYV